MRHLQHWLLVSLVFLALSLSQPLVALAAEVAAPQTEAAAPLFELHCAGCHAAGGNIIRRGKTLKQKALQRNGRDSLESIADIVTHGKGVMSAFGDRLSEDEITAIAQYVLDQAANDWR